MASKSKMPLLSRLKDLLTAALLLSLTVQAARKPKNAVLLSSIKSLTFHDGKLTTGRRLDPIPQMTCVGGSAQDLFKPEAIRCNNAGSSYSLEDIEWTCTASVPVEFKLGSTEVVCEGYDSADDEYVLKGSCAVEYRLVLTDVGEQKYGSNRASGRRSSRKATESDGSSKTVSLLFWALFVGVALWMVYSAFFRNRTTGRIPPSWTARRPGGDGDGGDDDNGPPPPYTPYRSKASSSTTYTRQMPRAAPAYGRQNQGQGWRPGFWTGAAAGAAGGWLAGRQNSAPQAPRPQQSTGWWGGSRDPGEGSSTGRTSAAPGPSYSNERHTSTGFGGTRRR